jgi:hypothetical protein
VRINIYKLRRQAADWVIDEKHPVAVVTVKEGQGSFHFYDKAWKTELRQLFTEPARAFRGGGKTPDGAYFDAFVTYPAWTREAIELIVSDILRGYTLGGKIIDDEASALKPSRTSRRKVLLGCIIGLVLCCLAIALAIAAGEWYKASMVSRVEKAVRASFPEFCNQEGEQITVQMSALPPSWSVYRYWDVRCDSISWIGPAMTVDVQSCAVFKPQTATFEWFQSYGGMFKDGQRLTVCP